METHPRVGFSMPGGKMAGFALKQEKIFEEKKLAGEQVAGARILKNSASLSFSIFLRFAYLA